MSKFERQDFYKFEFKDFLFTYLGQLKLGGASRLNDCSGRQNGINDRAPKRWTIMTCTTTTKCYASPLTNFVQYSANWTWLTHTARKHYNQDTERACKEDYKLSQITSSYPVLVKWVFLERVRRFGQQLRYRMEIAFQQLGLVLARHSSRTPRERRSMLWRKHDWCSQESWFEKCWSCLGYGAFSLIKYN